VTSVFRLALICRTLSQMAWCDSARLALSAGARDTAVIFATTPTTSLVALRLPPCR